MRGHSSTQRGLMAAARRKAGGGGGWFHAAVAGRSVQGPAPAAPGRYGRMFNLAPAHAVPEKALRQLAEAMTLRADPGKNISETSVIDENPAIPAGYTYFGQFIAHDITFDPTPLTEARMDPDAITDYRTPALDLDCLYGRGPDDQPYLYVAIPEHPEWKPIALRMGSRMGSLRATVGTLHDLPRMPDTKIAVLGDKRNDENKIVGQIHSVLIEFHNKILRKPEILDSPAVRRAIEPGLPPDDAAFHAASTAVRWHYQWIVVHDFLERLCMPGTVARVLNGGRPALRHYPLYEDPFVPIEFAAAAFRFGHAMVRTSYALNFGIGTAGARIPLFGDNPKLALNGFPGISPVVWGIDWGFFLDGDLRPHIRDGFKVPQPSFRLDTNLSVPLHNVPEFQAEGNPYTNLAYRDLERGQRLGLPSGQIVARVLGLEPLSDDVLWDAGSRRFGNATFPKDDAQAFEEVRSARAKIRADWGSGSGSPLRENAPLWYYILREAEYFGVEKKADDPGIAFGGQHLGPVGSQIVAETLIGLLWCDQLSFLHAPDFKPHELIAPDGKLSLGTLFRFALSA